MTKLDLTINSEQFGPSVRINYAFWRAAGRFPCVVGDHWQSESLIDLKGFGKEVARYEWRQGFDAVLVSRREVCRVTRDGYNVSVQVASSAEAAWSAVARMRAQWPAVKYDRDDGSIFMRFWFQSPQGPISSSRRIVVPKWPEIECNYAADLTGLMARKELESARGKLILWHGVPGTGKTYAIRAMARQWSDWAQFEYVVDPEQFFGSAQYMMTVLLNGGGETPVASSGTVPESPWRVLVLEDAGELLEMDAKIRTGQGLSRLLNLSEGLVGQGLKVALLITTNEKLGDLHPAVSRPGRCLAEVEFKALPKAHASEWLGAEVDRPMTLAELYQTQEGGGLVRPKRVSLGLSR